MISNSKEFLDRYVKVKDTIESCVSNDHIKVANQMIDNLIVLCLNNSLSYDFYIFYINQLKSILKKKTDEILKKNI